MVSKINKLIFLLPPKTGSSSILRCLKISKLPLSEIVNYKKYPTIHLTLEEIIELYSINLDELNQYKIIQIVRNPYNRIASAYFHQMKLQNMYIEFEKFLEKIEETKHLLPHNLDEFYDKFYGNITYKHNSFRNNHWGGVRFYYEQIWFNDLNLKNITYFKLEDLDKDYSSLSNFIGINTNKFPHINKNQTPSDYNRLYNEKCISIVSELYKNDLKYFNYEF